jgi:hypothetical protein
MRYITILLISLISISATSKEDYDKYFTQNSLRVDFIFAGDANSETIYLDNLKKEPFWGGSKVNLLDDLNYGEYKYEVIHKESNQLIFSRGFCTMFEEWQTTAEAGEIKKSFMQTVTLPYPKDEILLKLYSRNYEGQFELIFETDINPSDYFINPETVKFEFEKKLDNGDPANKVDLVFLAEGYTKEEMGKFEEDAQSLIDYMFTIKPFDKYKSHFNIWLVKSISEDSGTDIPGKSIYKKTALNSNFYTFDSERYLTTMDVFSVRDAASVVPYDDICILVNTEKYGGGGVYNHYCISSVDNIHTNKVFIYEFGHSFAGLGDEYYNSSTSYNDFFNLKIEPWQPNLTTLVDFNNKWEKMIDKKTPVPTPRESEYESTVGVFEGGGYVNKDMYSPYMDCRMKSNKPDGFCPVCQEAISKMILFKSE